MSNFQIIRGCPFPCSPVFKKQNIEQILDYVPHDGDVIIASYPKTGTTWLQYTVLQIISKGESFPDMDDTIDKHVPFLEMTGTSILDEMESPRIYKHHCPYNLVQKNNKAKYLYIYRKPEDTVVSFYHFTVGLGFQAPSLDAFFENFLTGQFAYGHYFDHVLSFFAHKDDENLLLISYEKFLRNRKEEVLKIAKFLGEEYFQSLSEDDQLLEKILKHTSFDYMKKNLSLTHPHAKVGGEDKKINFFRKGVVGDGKQSLSSDQLKRLKNLMLERMAGTSLIDEWTTDE